jgi:predicted DNA-binding transcriptional regulator AlpA
MDGDRVAELADEIATLRQELAEALSLVYHLAGVAELAEHHSVSKSMICTWADRYTHFPRPVVTVKAARLWDRREVADWVQRRQA